MATSEKGEIMGKTNQSNEESLRAGLAEKARLTADKVAKERLEEQEREDKMHIHEDPNEKQRD